jgi:hypothetical protein
VVLVEHILRGLVRSCVTRSGGRTGSSGRWSLGQPCAIYRRAGALWFSGRRSIWLLVVVTSACCLSAACWPVCLAIWCSRTNSESANQHSTHRVSERPCCVFCNLSALRNPHQQPFCVVECTLLHRSQSGAQLNTEYALRSSSCELSPIRQNSPSSIKCANYSQDTT